jgi:hypothetical protein
MGMVDVMNAQEMLDHAFGKLEGPARERLEQDLATDPAQAEKFGRLVLAINQLLDDGRVIEPPIDLAGRTLQYVSENRRRRRTLLDYVPTTVPFRWADVAVAASILIAGLLTLVPAIQRSKGKMNQAACVFNLQQLGLGLAQYGHEHRMYPYSSPDCPREATGTFAARLHDMGLLDDLTTLDCPCNGSCRQVKLPDHQALCNLRADDPTGYQKLLCWDYAYHGGYRDGQGPAHPLTTPCSMNIPLLADQPPHQADARTILPGNSPNHGGTGQNVLFTDLHVGWHNTRRLGPHDPDMFLNDIHEPGPGLRLLDAVLLPSDFPFAR